MNRTGLRVAVVQGHARLHYAVPTALQRRGVLERVFTDWYNAPGSLEAWVGPLVCAARPGLGKKLAGRFNAELDAARVRHSPMLILRQELRRNPYGPKSRYFWASDVADRWVRRRGFGEANAVFGFVRNVPPPLLGHARAEGLRAVADQIIAPAIVERREHETQRDRFGDWEPAGETQPFELTAELESATWRETDLITCASAYVRSSLIEVGQPADRVKTIPYPIDTSHWRAIDRRGREGPVVIGFVGRVGLRKGIPYFCEVARRLAGERARFVAVGPVAIEPTVVEKYRDAVEFVGRVSRAEVMAWLEKFDVLFFPSTCEGSAGAVSEAMATGLPIVASPNSGTTARDGVEGHLVPYDDLDAAAERLAALVDDPDRRHALGVAARERVERSSLDAYGVDLAEAIGGALDAPPREVEPR